MVWSLRYDPTQHHRFVLTDEVSSDEVVELQLQEAAQHRVLQQVSRTGIVVVVIYHQNGFVFAKGEQK